MHPQNKQLTSLYIFISVSYELFLYSWIASEVVLNKNPAAVNPIVNRLSLGNGLALTHGF